MTAKESQTNFELLVVKMLQQHFKTEYKFKFVYLNAKKMFKNK